VSLVPAERGITTLAPRVVEKIAARAAGEVAQVFGLSRTLAGHTLGAERVRADAELDGHVAVLRLDLSVAFPAPLIPLTRTVREHVTNTVQTLCGLHVDHIDLTVAALRHPSAEHKRVT
jgi:uncharacterized alkaline shock family protein YloU